LRRKLFDCIHVASVGNDGGELLELIDLVEIGDCSLLLERRLISADQLRLLKRARFIDGGSHGCY